MVTAQTQYRLVQAQTYFREHLAVGDYYAEGQESPGQWLGEGARRLGLNGRVREAAFLRLCENRHPDTARTLTARLNTVRQESGGTVANRRIFYDFTFSPPKSVSIQALIGGDEWIRDVLRAHGLLGADEVRVQALEKCDLTQAQKQDPRAYPPEAVLVFTRRFRKVEAGATGRLAGFLADHVLVETAGRLVPVAHRFLDRVTVCQPRDIPVSGGDRLLIKANRRLASGARVTNGERVTVGKVSPEGQIQLTDGRELGPEFREFLPGYAVTSYGSQGKTVDYVLISDSGSRAATNAQQWYVSISRGRKGLKIYTPDPQALRERIRASGERPLAMELVRSGPWFPRWAAVRQGLRRFGERVLRRLPFIHFARPQPSTPPVHHERNRKLGV